MANKNQNPLSKFQYLTKEGLENLSDAELKATYKEVLGKNPKNGSAKEDIVAKILEAIPSEDSNDNDIEEEEVDEKPKGKKAQDGFFFGNKDSENKYPIPITNKNFVVVRQNSVQRLNGGLVDVPNTFDIQAYPIDQFEKMVTPSKDTGKDFFGESKMKIKILHDPR